jgi:hypothetical protein
LSATTAHARPSLGIGEAGARAGDVVHFSVYGLDHDTSYEVEVDDEWVTDGWGDGDVITGTFTMPDLGAGSWTVTVRVKLRGRRNVSGELQYLGRALPVKTPVVQTPAPGPAAPQPTVAAQAPSPAAISSPKAVEGPAALPQSSAPPHRSLVRSITRHRKAHRRTAQRKAHRKAQRRAGRTHDRRRAAHRKHTHSARWFARAWLRAFRVVPYPAHRPAAGRTEDGGRIFSLNAIAPRTAELAATAVAAGGGGVDAALTVPALLGLAALALAGTAAGRRRALASRSRRD